MTTRLTARRRIANAIADMKLGIARKLAGSRIGRTRQQRSTYGDRDLGSTIEWKRTDRGYVGHAASGEIYAIQPITVGTRAAWSLRSAFGPQWGVFGSTHKAMIEAEMVEARSRYRRARASRGISRNFGGPE